MRSSTFIFVSCALLAAPVGADAQTSLASRVAEAPDGDVRVQFDSRVGVCGDGRDVVGYRNAIFARNFQSIGGRWNDSRCVPGPLRVTLTVERGQVTRMRTQVGGAWPPADSRVTDLGVVPAREASAYFFSIVPRLESEGGKDRLLIPAVLADEAEVMRPLLALARDTSRTLNTRRAAVQWLGLMGDASVIPTLVEFARADEGDESDERGKGAHKSGKKGLGSAALAALSSLEGNVGVPALIDLARTGNVGIRRNAVFWLGQTGDARAYRALRAIIENEREANGIRAHAIFSMTHNGDTPPSEFAWLRSLYSRLEGDELKESILQGMAEEGGAGGRWLIERARDAKEPMRFRRTALFWAGQREETRTADIVSVYREARESELREHAIFVLSQRKDDASTNELLRIAREEEDRSLRGKALFWLAQKDDPRVRKLIADLILK